MRNGTFYISENLRSLLFFIESLSGFILITAFILLLIRRKKSKMPRSYVTTVVSAVAFVLLGDVIAISSAGTVGKYGIMISYVSNYIYYLSTNTAVWAIIRYTIEMIEDNGGKVKPLLSRLIDIIYVAAVANLFVNIFYPTMFYFDEMNYYQRGDWFLLSQLPAALALIALVVIAVKYKDYMQLVQKITILSCVLLPVAAEVMQIVVYGFSWLALSMDIACFAMIAQYMYSTTKEGYYNTDDQNGGRHRTTKLIFLFALIGILFFAAVTKITVGVATDQVSKEINAHYETLSDKISTQASSWLEKEAAIVMNHKANLEILGNYDSDYITKYLRRILNDYDYNDDIYDLYFVSKNNEMSSGNGFDPDEAIDFTRRAWYIGAYAKKGDVNVSKPYIDLQSGQYVVTLSAAIYDSNGEFQGCLALDMFVNELFDIILGQEMPEDSYMMILDENLYVLSYPGVDNAFEKVSKLTDVYSEYRTIVSDIYEVSGKKGDAITLIDKDGKTRRFFYSQIDTCGWYIVEAISSSAMRTTEKTLLESVIVALVIYLVIGILMTLWATNGVIHKLQEARAEANEANEAKSQFLANMSHEIRTPINAVLGMDEIILQECTDDNIRGYATNIRTAGQALLGIINDILDFSKVESGKFEIIPVEYYVQDLIDTCKNLIELRAKEKDLKFTITRGDYLPTKLHGDENRIRQIISNMLTNAVKYTKQGSVEMSVTFDKTSDTEGVLRVSVKDTGIGIKQENMQDLFDSFKRIDENKNRNIEGTGLGMAITKRLVDMMGGDIQVESEYGKGSTFTVNIPQPIIDATNSQINDGNDTTEVKSVERAIDDLSAFHILAVDDVAMNIMVLGGLLKKTGVQMDKALSGQEALDLIAENKYDMIFLDHMMPGKDGIQTFKEMKELYPENIEDVPVIMLTANAIAGVESEYLGMGFDGYLSKPIVKEDLYDCLHKRLIEK